jgi:hypothetical protein
VSARRLGIRERLGFVGVVCWVECVPVNQSYRTVRTTLYAVRDRTCAEPTLHFPFARRLSLRRSASSRSGCFAYI